MSSMHPVKKSDLIQASLELNKIFEQCIINWDTFKSNFKSSDRNNFKQINESIVDLTITMGHPEGAQNLIIIREQIEKIISDINSLPIPEYVNKQLRKELIDNIVSLKNNIDIKYLQEKIFIDYDNLLKKVPNKKDVLKKIYDDLVILNKVSSEFRFKNEIEKMFLKEKIHDQINKIEQLLSALKFENNDERKPSENLLDDIKQLNKKLIVETRFSEPFVNKAMEFAKKEGGVNQGCNITNVEGVRFTIKQGSTVGNTLAEVFSSMVLDGIVKALIQDVKSETPVHRQLIAKAFLVTKNPESKDKDLSIEDRCMTRLYAASQWSKVKASFDACQLFGLEKRIKAAGTRQVEDFEDLRDLNAACDLGLEFIALPPVLIADFDMHTENYKLQISDEKVPSVRQDDFDAHLSLFRQELLKTQHVSRKERVMYLIGIISILKAFGADLYFHKIDHDSGFLRYADPERKVELLTHRTSPIHFSGGIFKLQPTLHITEITGGTKEGLDQLFLSEVSIEGLLNINYDTELKIVLKAANEFFDIIREKSLAIVSKDIQNGFATEFYLLNELYYHLKEERRPIPSSVDLLDILKMREEIIFQLKLGTQFKVQDLHIQLYQRLLEKDEENILSDKEKVLKSFLEKQEYIKNLTLKYKAV